MKLRLRFKIQDIKEIASRYQYKIKKAKRL